jgi:hypothetical protein
MSSLINGNSQPSIESKGEGLQEDPGASEGPKSTIKRDEPIPEKSQLSG